MTDKLRTIILRMPKPAAATDLLQPVFKATSLPGEVPTAPAPRVRTEALDLEEGERIEIAEEDDVLGVGLAMPVSLIAPMDGAAPAAGAGNWGIDALGAHDIGPTAGAGVKVAVLDTGIADHEAFDGVNPIVRNFTDETDADINGHGTHCAGTIFGRDVGGRRIGVSRGVTEPLIAKVLGAGGGDSKAVMDAITWAQSEGAMVISMSLGIDYPGFRERLLASGRDALEATSLALRAYRENVRLFDKISAVYSNALSINAPLLIAASGNESERPRYTIGAAPPSEADGILGVAAIQRDGKIARFSNTGADCSAPGVDIVSADYANRSGLKSLSGTSMATPHVAGAAVLHAQRLMQEGAFSARHLREEVLANTVRVPELSRADGGRGAVRV